MRQHSGVCFVYFAAQLISPTVNISPNGSSQVLMTVKATIYDSLAPGDAAVIFAMPYYDEFPSNVCRATPGLSFDHHTFCYVHMLSVPI